MSVTVSITDEVETCLRLRRVIFIDEQNVPERDELDGLDPEATHLLAIVQGVPVGTARILFGENLAKIGRVCVLKEHRGAGHATALMRKALEVARRQAQRAKLSAQVDAMGLYERLGFVALGPVYDDAGIPHRDMVRDL